MTDLIQSKFENAAFTILLNRPDRRNALASDMLDQFLAAPSAEKHPEAHRRAARARISAPGPTRRVGRPRTHRSRTITTTPSARKSRFASRECPPTLAPAGPAPGSARRSPCRATWSSPRLAASRLPEVSTVSCRLRRGGVLGATSATRRRSSWGRPASLSGEEARVIPGSRVATEGPRRVRPPCAGSATAHGYSDCVYPVHRRGVPSRRPRSAHQRARAPGPFPRQPSPDHVVSRLRRSRSPHTAEGGIALQNRSPVWIASDSGASIVARMLVSVRETPCWGEVNGRPTRRTSWEAGRRLSLGKSTRNTWNHWRLRAALAGR
jgi:hypothetical protein